MANELLRRMDQPFIACGAGRGTEEVVWRQATSAEAATSEGEAASVLVDVRKFYENFQLDALQQRADRAGVPGRLSRLACNVYRGMRMVKLNQSTLLVGYCSTGLPAGCCLCMLWVVTYSMPGLLWLHERWPHLQLSVYLDDLVLGCEGHLPRCL